VGQALERIYLLEADPALGERLYATKLPAARRSLVTPVKRLPAGDWDVGQEEAPAAGFLLLEGCLTREVRLLGHSAAIEFLAQGDLLQPSAEGDLGSVPSSVEWRVLEPTRLAVLDSDFLHAVHPWPEVLAELLSRQERRAEWLASVLAISHLPRVDLRVLVLLWHFADRWGTVRSGEVTVSIPLTHVDISRLIGARRPTVTTALRRLGEAGLVVHNGKGSWVLRGGPPTRLDGLSEAGTAVPTSRRAAGT
jgi:CRP/FNR family cyclic AMP-dependent transcriptional regulator